jgi:hypothetical protein
MLQSVKCNLDGVSPSKGLDNGGGPEFRLVGRLWVKIVAQFEAQFSPSRM